MDRDRLIERFAYTERMKTLTGQTVSSSTFAALGLSASMFFGGVPLLGFAPTAVTAVLFAAMAYGAWRCNRHYVEQSRRTTEELADRFAGEVTKPLDTFAPIAAMHRDRLIGEQPTLLH